MFGLYVNNSTFGQIYKKVNKLFPANIDTFGLTLKHDSDIKGKLQFWVSLTSNGRLSLACSVCPITKSF